MANLLNLQKGQMLNLTKENPGLSEINFAGGWDVKRKGLFKKLFATDYDLDLVAYLRDSGGRVYKTVYFGSKSANGVRLDHDNLTGEGDGDDETIFLDLNNVDARCESIVFAIVIYGASMRNQTFNGVENAFVRIYNPLEHNKELCRFNLSNDGGYNTSCVVGSLRNIDGDWEFTAIGDYINKASIEDVKNYVNERVY